MSDLESPREDLVVEHRSTSINTKIYTPTQRVDFGEEELFNPEDFYKNDEKRAEYKRQEKFNEGYDGLTIGEKAFLDIAANKIQKKSKNVYEMQTIDGKGENIDAKQEITDKIIPEMKNKGYELTISSSYRAPQKQFEIFFGDKSLTVANGLVVPTIPNFVSSEIIDEKGLPKKGHESQYNEILAAYIKRAEYVAPPQYSEHQTGRAFDFKLAKITKDDANKITTMLGDEKFGDKKGFDEAKKILETSGFKQTYTWEPRHWFYNK